MREKQKKKKKKNKRAQPEFLKAMGPEPIHEPIHGKKHVSNNSVFVYDTVCQLS
jgi:hypothetical protein